MYLKRWYVGCRELVRHRRHIFKDTCSSCRAIFCELELLSILLLVMLVLYLSLMEGLVDSVCLYRLFIIHRLKPLLILRFLFLYGADVSDETRLELELFEDVFVE